MFVQQRIKAASSAEHMKTLAAESASADSIFQQLDKLRVVYEEYVKIAKEAIPQAEKDLTELTDELEQKTQTLDDVSEYNSADFYRNIELLSIAKAVNNVFII